MPKYRNYVTQVVPVEERDFRLRKTVFLGYTDVSAGGIRALLGITMKREYMNIVIPELGTSALACECPITLDVREREYSPIQVWNLKYEQFSVILVNTVLKADKCHFVCSRICDLCSLSCIEKLVVLSALKVDVLTDNPHPIYENVINDTPLTDLPPLPGQSRMNDPFLSTLIQMVKVDFLPVCFLTIPSHRACLGPAQEEDGSVQVIQIFQQTINKFTKIDFDEQFSISLIYKGENEENTNSVAMMYS